MTAGSAGAVTAQEPCYNDYLHFTGPRASENGLGGVA